MPNTQHWIQSEPGDGHANEDVALVRLHPQEALALLCALADGQGGRSGGADAARVAAGASLDAASTFLPGTLLEEAAWYPILGAADEAACEDDAAGYTTLVSLCVSDGRVCGASCGDSGALLLNGGRETLLTENQRKDPPVGTGAAYPVAFSARLGPDWKLLVVSDGVWKGLGWDGIARLARAHGGAELIAALRRAALEENGGRLGDDFSVILLEDGSGS